MLTCAPFLDRLYDEDVRVASREGSAPPADLRDHMEGCAPCRAAYTEAAEDDALIRRSLLVAPPHRLRAAVLQKMRAALPPPGEPLVDWRAALSWAGTGGALGAAVSSSLFSPAVYHAVAFAVGLGLAVALAAVREELAQSSDT